IHAVCLSYPEPEAEEKHFRRLKHASAQPQVQTVSVSVDIESFSLPSVATATVDSLTDALKDIKLVSLIAAPNLGLGQPGDGDGLLAGAIPTAETVIHGIVQITPQLMSLGYATGKSIFPDHAGVYPPVDRMSILTYWWGLELVLPPPTLKYLDQVQSVSNTVMNFMTALSAVITGVREVLPFIRYISQYMEFEFGEIKDQDAGQGVVCAATWIMPAAMVPRPWDFASPPSSDQGDSDGKDPAPSAPVPGSPVLTPVPDAPEPQPDTPKPLPETPAPPVTVPTTPDQGIPVDAPVLTPLPPLAGIGGILA
ncbi:hypothetical protein EW146_g8919, partial [Bondarzewia mesenterica]